MHITLNAWSPMTLLSISFYVHSRIDLFPFKAWLYIRFCTFNPYWTPTKSILKIPRSSTAISHLCDGSYQDHASLYWAIRYLSKSSLLIRGYQGYRSHYWRCFEVLDVSRFHDFQGRKYQLSALCINITVHRVVATLYGMWFEFLWPTLSVNPQHDSKVLTKRSQSWFPLGVTHPHLQHIPLSLRKSSNTLKRRSAEADVAGMSKHRRAMTLKAGKATSSHSTPTTRFSTSVSIGTEGRSRWRAPLTSLLVPLLVQAPRELTTLLVHYLVAPTTGTDLPYINMKRSHMVSASTILSFELEIWSISLSIEILWTWYGFSPFYGPEIAC